MASHRVQRKALSGPALEALASEVLAHPLVGSSPLRGGFGSSRGFGLTFTRAGEAELRSRFGLLAPFLELALAPSAERRVAPLFSRPRTPNAFYANLLLLGDGGSVGRHTDATLREPSGLDQAVPEVVSVLYLRVPAGEGGRLQLFDRSRRVASIAPEAGALVHFRGSLEHEVTPLSTAAGQLRASLVCEQYHFAPEALARIPPLRVHSRAGFSAYLDDHGSRPPRPLVLEPPEEPTPG